MKLGCITLQSSGTPVQVPRLENFESLQCPPTPTLAVVLMLNTAWGATTWSQPSTATSHLNSWLIVLQCPGTDPFKYNDLNQERRTVPSETNGQMCSHSDTVHKEAQSWMRETESIFRCLSAMNCRVYCRHKMIINFKWFHCTHKSIPLRGHK